jgi:tetratricopeptide (TPR) repeat protein
VALRHLVRLSPAAQQKPQALAIRVAAGASPEALDALGSHAGLSEADVLGIVPILRKARRTETLLSLLRRLQARGLAGRSSLETLAAVYEDQQRYGEARKALEQVAERIGRADVPLLLALARMSWQEHDYKGTLSYLGQARHLQPEHAGVHFFFGMTAVSLDLPIEAKKSLARALELDPGNEYAHYAYGAVLAQERDASPSIPHFQAYAAKRPEDARGKFALAVAYFLSNQFEDAKTRLAPLTADPKTAAGAHYFLGRIARRQEDLTEAEKQLQASVALRSDQPDVHAELGYVYMRLGRMELARKELQRALSIDRDHYQANTHLLVLYQRLKDPRAGDQASVLDKIKEKRSVQERSLWQTIEIRPW